MPNVRMRETSCISPTILFMLTRYMRMQTKNRPKTENGRVKRGFHPRKNHNAKVIKEPNIINSPWVRFMIVITPKTKLKPDAASP